MWKAWPYGSPEEPTFPWGSVAVVPATATYAPTRTAREYPTIGSQRAPDATLFRSMEPRNRRQPKRLALVTTLSPTSPRAARLSGGVAGPRAPGGPRRSRGPPRPVLRPAPPPPPRRAAARPPPR